MGPCLLAHSLTHSLARSLTHSLAHPNGASTAPSSRRTRVILDTSTFTHPLLPASTSLSSFPPATAPHTCCSSTSNQAPIHPPLRLPLLVRHTPPADDGVAPCCAIASCCCTLRLSSHLPPNQRPRRRRPHPPPPPSLPPLPTPPPLLPHPLPRT
ncbi:unnamed protein product [Closterium sp. NIES-53]